MEAARSLAPKQPTQPAAANPQSSLELVPPAAPDPDRPPEQLLLMRTLEIVRDRVESIHAAQRAITEGLRDLKASLPMQRKPLSKRAQQLHVLAVATRRNGLCPCCQETPVCNESGRLAGAEFDHWYSRNKNRVTQTWLVCGGCNALLVDTDFKATARSAFESYQQALRPLLSRQVPLGLG